MNEAWVGIDVSKATLDVVLMRADTTQHIQVSNDKAGFRTLHHFLEKRCPNGASVCLEATGLYGDGIAAFLHGQGYRVSIVNPARIKAYGDSQLKRNKTDRSDAQVIADFCRTQRLEVWQPPAPEVQELRALLRHLDDLQTMLQQERNRLQAGESSSTVLSQLQQHIAFLETQITQLKQQIDDHFNQHPDLKQQRDLLTSIPGIGNLTAGRLLAELGDIQAFASARQVAAFVGVVAKNHNPLIRLLADRLRASGYTEMSIIGAAMHKLLHLAYGVLKSGQPFDAAYLERRLASA